MMLDMGEDCLILHAADGNYKLDIDLPFHVNNEEAGAQFHRKTKVHKYISKSYFHQTGYKFVGIFKRSLQEKKRKGKEMIYNTRASRLISAKLID